MTSFTTQCSCQSLGAQIGKMPMMTTMRKRRRSARPVQPLARAQMQLAHLKRSAHTSCFSSTCTPSRRLPISNQRNKNSNCWPQCPLSLQIPVYRTAAGIVPIYARGRGKVQIRIGNWIGDQGRVDRWLARYWTTRAGRYGHSQSRLATATSKLQGLSQISMRDSGFGRKSSDLRIVCRR